MRGDDAVVELVEGADWVGMPAVVIGELHVGFLAGSARRRNLAELERFLGHPVVEEIPVDREVARIYAEIVVALKEQGTPIPTNDVWVAASTARAGAPLIAYDTHFDEVARIGTVLLRPPSSG
jgi:tRNA(fMet)-specific endonuclease VapC